MSVPGASRTLARFAGQGVILGSAIYYSVKDYVVFKPGGGDLLKDSYGNLNQTFDINKVCRF